MKHYLATYRYKGDEYNLVFPADSWQDARDRLKAMSAGTIAGSDVQSIPTNSLTFAPASLWVRFITWWRNRP